MMKALQAEARTYCYVEFDDEDPMQVNIRSVGFAGEQRGWQASFGEGSLLRFSDFHGFFSDDAIQKVIHSAKNLQVVLLRQGQKLRGLEWDTMLLSYLTQPNRSNHQFEEIVFAHLQKTPAKLAADRSVATRELFSFCTQKFWKRGWNKSTRKSRGHFLKFLRPWNSPGSGLIPGSLKIFLSNLKRNSIH